MDIPNKVHLTVNGNEFNAEGSDKLVSDLFKQWREMVSPKPGAPQEKPKGSQNPNPSRFSHAVEEIRTKDGIRATWDIFTTDEKKRIISLMVNPPNGDTRDADAVLLVLYGYKQTWGTEEVKVTSLKTALNVSGLRPERIDKTVAPYMHQGLILKTGRGPGGKYRLTNPGLERAEALARSLFEKLV